MRPILTLDESLRPFATLFTRDGAYRLKTLDELDKDPPLGSDIQAVITNGGTGVPPQIAERLPNLKIICVNGVGTDKIPFDLLKRRGIALTTTHNYPTKDVADSALALLLGVRRNIVFNQEWILNGDWAAKGEPPLATSLAGSKTGIVGFGAIGQAIAQRAAGFDMEIAYCNRSPRNTPCRRIDSVAALAQWADNLILAIPGAPENHNLINADVLAKLGKNGVLINIARGSVVDQDALIRALRERTIQGAGLDVFLNEPDIDRAFLKLPNCLLSPHQGSATWQTRMAMAQNLRDNLDRFFAGRPLATPLNF